MNKTFFALTATLALALTAPAAAKEAPKSTTFSYEGVTYSYTTTKAGKATIYEGTAKPGNKFRLVRSGGQVTGTVNGSSVSFRMSDVEKISTTITLASR